MEMSPTTLWVFIYMYTSIIFLPERILSLDIAYVEEHSEARLPCKHDIPGDEFYRVKWFKSSRDDFFENGDAAVVSWDNASQLFTTNNYGIDKDFSLVIYNTSICDEGIYRCYVTRNFPRDPSRYDLKIISYEKVKSAHSSAVKYATSLRLPCSYNSKIASEVSVFWYLRKSTDKFKSDDQLVASWTVNERRVRDEYSLTDGFSLEIRNVSFENEAVFRCILDSAEETKTLASDTNVTVYALPRDFPLIQHFIEPNASFVNCSVDHVYPLLYPELKLMIDRQSYEIRNRDGTYNTSIRGKVPDVIHNTTVECSFPYFNYTGISSLYISFDFSVEDEAPHPKDCSVPTCPNQATSNIMIVSLLLIICLIVVIAVFVWKRHTKQQRQKDVKNTTAEIEYMV